MSDIKPCHYRPIAVSDKSTVVAEFIPEASTSTAYQTEAELEKEFIELLTSQGYKYLRITSEAQLIDNLRKQIERLNNIEFSDSEWKTFFTENIGKVNEGIEDKTKRIQEDHIQILKRDDNSTKNVMLIDKVNVHNNCLQVINQYEIEKGDAENSAARSNRYDVTILVNGLPLIHIELKCRGVDIREAFNQIDRYQRDSFWAGSGLFNYVQLFVISNGTLTKYYSNTTRYHHINEKAGNKRAKKTSNSFEFTSWWADASNRPIQDLTGFTRTFFAKHTILNILFRYCVLTIDKLLLVMRPYQIVATERILQKINISSYYNQLGTLAAGGYVWHTTGSGKTLTSFKTAQLASKLEGVEKVLFVVDRKDLDYQTMQEYDRFEKGAVDSNDSTSKLKSQLEKKDSKIIITTIQKLSKFISMNKGHIIYSGHVAIIFDECHRSQFGEMHKSITKAFKNYNLIGFTGTPIFAVNAGKNGNATLRTTPQAFGCFLHGDPSNCPDDDHQMAIHAYTIVDAIGDKNVLPLRVDYIDTIKMPEGIKDKKVSAIDTERALLAPERLSMVISYILEHFDQKTKRSHQYLIDGKRAHGFNALFATASIEAAKKYYSEFKAQQERLPENQRLKVGIIYSYAPNEAITNDFYLDDEDFETGSLDKSSRDSLDEAIADYNKMFGTTYDTSSDKFQAYYKDLSNRLKSRDIDLVIVVNMFLTGFDATTLNTLFVDKRLVNHGLLQAYSRTNRILNSVKTYGNIVTFRNLQAETDDALALFGNKDARGIVLLKPYADYYQEYKQNIQRLLSDYPLGGEPLISETQQKDFVKLYGAVLRLENVLTSFDEFDAAKLLTERQSQDYRSLYLDLYNEFRRVNDAEKESINDDLVFEIELIKQVEINVAYILMLVQKWYETKGNKPGQKEEVLSKIRSSIDSSPSLRNKKDLIMAFVASVSIGGVDLDKQWRSFVTSKRTEELDNIIAEERLVPDETRKFIKRAFRDGSIPTTGTSITKILPPASRFSSNDNHSETKRRVLGRLNDFFDRFAELGG